MQKLKVEIILVIILIPILVYVGWQAYNTYIKQPPVDLEEFEIPEELEGKPEGPIQFPEPKPSPFEKGPLVPKGTLDYIGYTERNPLEHSLPVKIKKEKPPVTKKTIGKRTKETPTKKEKPPKQIVLPKFTITGIVWGEASPRAIIDHKVYKTGDIIKGAKILGITERGIHIIYEEKEFWVTIQ